ncbi:MAG: PTS transporter subunit EIIC [Erysipelotrichaceae bacterium]|jgi:PTS system beta-glucosides-specific IIC component
MKKKNYDELANIIFELVGGVENISRLSHCVTRIRFTVKDKTKVIDDQVKALPVVVGSQWLGEQYQVIVGNEVDHIYDALCRIGDFQKEAIIDENLDRDLEKGFSFKKIGDAILAYMSPTMTAVIPILMAACLFKTLASILGPGMLNLISAESDLYLLLNGIMYNAFFYFISLFLGYSAANALGINPMYGIYIGALIIAPDYMNLVGVRESFSVFGISTPVANYSGSFLPVVLGVWMMSYVYKFFNKYIPKSLKIIFVPFLTVLVMTPVMFLVCAPLGSYLGNLFGNFFMALSESNVIVRVFGAMLLAIIMPYLILGGMHGPLVGFAIASFLANGVETFSLPIMTAYNFAVFGIALGAAIKLKKPENKSAAFGFYLTGILGSVTEPSLYGVVMKYKGCMKALLIACAAVGLYVGILVPKYYALSGATIFTFWIPWAGGGTANLISGSLLNLGAMVLAAILAYFVEYKEN